MWPTLAAFAPFWCIRTPGVRCPRRAPPSCFLLFVLHQPLGCHPVWYGHANDGASPWDGMGGRLVTCKDMEVSSTLPPAASPTMSFGLPSRAVRLRVEVGPRESDSCCPFACGCTCSSRGLAPWSSQGVLNSGHTMRMSVVQRSFKMAPFDDSQTAHNMQYNFPF